MTNQDKGQSKESVTSEIRIEQLFAEYGIRMTAQRTVIAQMLLVAEDHPDVEELHRRASSVDSRISIATVTGQFDYLRMLEFLKGMIFEMGVLGMK